MNLVVVAAAASSINFMYVLLIGFGMSAIKWMVALLNLLKRTCNNADANKSRQMNLNIHCEHKIK